VKKAPTKGEDTEVLGGRRQGKKKNTKRGREKRKIKRGEKQTAHGIREGGPVKAGVKSQGKESLINFLWGVRESRENESSEKSTPSKTTTSN